MQQGYLGGATNHKHISAITVNAHVALFALTLKPWEILQQLLLLLSCAAAHAEASGSQQGYTQQLLGLQMHNIAALDAPQCGGVEKWSRSAPAVSWGRFGRFCRLHTNVAMQLTVYRL